MAGATAPAVFFGLGLTVRAQEGYLFNSVPAGIASAIVSPPCQRPANSPVLLATP